MLIPPASSQSSPQTVLWLRGSAVSSSACKHPNTSCKKPNPPQHTDLTHLGRDDSTRLIPIPTHSPFTPPQRHSAAAATSVSILLPAILHASEMKDKVREKNEAKHTQKITDQADVPVFPSRPRAKTAPAAHSCLCKSGNHHKPRK